MLMKNYYIYDNQDEASKQPDGLNHLQVTNSKCIRTKDNFVNLYILFPILFHFFSSCGQAMKSDTFAEFFKSCELFPMDGREPRNGTAGLGAMSNVQPSLHPLWSAVPELLKYPWPSILQHPAITSTSPTLSPCT